MSSGVSTRESDEEVRMGKSFEIENEIEVGATPERAWQAIATGEGMDGWFMGRNEIEPGEGGKIRTVTPEWTDEATITTWDPPNRFSYRNEESEDGSYMSFDYSIEEKEKGQTSIRWTHKGFLGGEDWEATYAAMAEGDEAYFHKLGLYLTYFFGRKATPIETYGPEVRDRDQAMALFKKGLGLEGPVAVHDKVLLTPAGLEPIEGVVEWVSPSFLGFRSDDAIYRFIYAFTGPLMVAHHIFRDVDEQKELEAWKAWLNGLAS